MKRIASLVLLLATAAAPYKPKNLDAPEIARGLGVSVQEADRRLAFQDRMAALRARLNNDPAFVELRIEHKPIHRAVASFTGNDAGARLRRYTSDPNVVARTVRFSRAELARHRVQADALLAKADVPILGSWSDQSTVTYEVIDRAVVDAAKLVLPPTIRFVERGGVIAVPQAAGPVTHFPQYKYSAGASMEALAGGVLIVRNGCLRISPDGKSPGMLVVWPAEIRLREPRKGQIELFDQSNGVRLRPGQTIRIGGGGGGNTISRRGLVAPIPAKCQGPYWIGGETVSAR